MEASWTTICALLNVFNLLIHEVFEKFDKNCKKTIEFGNFFVLLIFSMLIWGLFHIENNIQLFKVAIAQRICALLDGFNIVIHGVYPKFDKNCIKMIKLGNFLFFLSYWVLIWDLFHLKNSIYLFIEAYLTTNLCLVERIQPSNPWSFWKVWQKLQKKTIKFGTFLVFWYFRC